MAVARVVCVVSLHCELFDDFDSADARINSEGKWLAAANRVLDRLATGQVVEALNAADATSNRQRPYVDMLDLPPSEWSVCYNSFRRSDEFECSLPLRWLPIPPESIRTISCEAVIRHVGAEAWGASMEEGFPLLSRADFPPDFVGVCTQIDVDVQPGSAPMLKLKFQDYLGLLVQTEVRAGRKLDHHLPVSQAVAQFLVGTPAEKLQVAWVDLPSREPSLAGHLPKVAKKGGKTGGTAAQHGKKLIDVIAEACQCVGVVPTVRADRLELAFGGTLYEGQDRGGEMRATLLVSQVIESVSAHRQLVGLKSKTIQVTSYDPDKGVVHTARWPASPQQKKAVTVAPGKPAAVPLLEANVGLPGVEQLDEAILRVEVAPVANPELLPEVARMIFLERTRQKLKVTLKTHAPWADPTAPDMDGGTLLRLRAGDNVTLGYLGSEEEGNLLPPEVHVLAGGASAEAIADLLQDAGVDEDVARELGRVVERAPRTSRWRIDEVRVSGGATKDAEIELHLVNFLVLDSDLQGKGGPSPQTTVKNLSNIPSFAWKAQSDEAIQQTFAKAYSDVSEGASSEQEAAAARAQVDRIYAQVMKGR